LSSDDAQQIVAREPREREAIADFQLPIVDLTRAARSTLTFGCTWLACEALMKFSFGLIMFLSFGVAVHAQTKTAGSICIAPTDKPASGEKSLANPSGGNLISTYSIQVDKMSPVVASNERPVRISSIATGRKHLVKIIGDGKVRQSFWFNFSTFKTKDLCLFFNSLYETWSLWDGKEGRAICRCK